MFRAEILKIICVSATLFCLSTAFVEYPAEIFAQIKGYTVRVLKLLQTEIKNLLAGKKYFSVPMNHGVARARGVARGVARGGEG